MTIAYLDMIGKKPRADEEERLQRAIVQHLRLLASPDVIWWHTPNGEHRSKRTGARLKAMGVQPGHPDLSFVLAGGKAAFIEIKRPGGRLSPEQKAFEAKCVRLGIEHAVIYSIDQALEILKAWEVLK